MLRSPESANALCQMAVTTHKERWNTPVFVQIKDGKRIYKTFRLKEQFRKIKLGSLEPEQVI